MEKYCKYLDFEVKVNGRHQRENPLMSKKL